MSFHSLENKELLWDILQEDGYFNNIRPSLMQNIKTEFENTMVEMDHDNNNESLINKNKQFISNFTYKLKVLNTQPFELKDNNNASTFLKLNDTGEIYKAQDFKKSRQEQMNLEFSNKKKEMDSMLAINKPDDINFAQLNANEEPIKNIDDILKRTIENRNIEINDINEGYDKKTAEKWIGSERKITFKEETENIVLETNEVSDSISVSSNVLNTEKKDELLDLLNTLLINQKKIMEHLNINH
tara:strand:- start:9976 stop:10704 length:729 start_codon:yes stop_codon:yes gene_type:complete